MLMMMTNLEDARQIAAYYHCLLSKEAMHAFADILVIGRVNAFLMREMSAEGCCILKKV